MYAPPLKSNPNMAQIFSSGTFPEAGSQIMPADQLSPVACDGLKAKDGTLVVVGHIQDLRAGVTESALALKFFEDGQCLSKIYAARYDRELVGVTELADGNLIAVGQARSALTSTEPEIWVAQLSADTLEITWERSIPGYLGCAVTATLDGGFAVVGLSCASGGTQVVKFAKDAKIRWAVQWNKTYAGRTMYAIVPTEDGGFICAGYGDPNAGVARAKISAMRLNSDGSLVWAKLYATEIELPIKRCGLIQTKADGKFVIAIGQWLCKIDGRGNLPSIRLCKQSKLACIAELADGKLAIGGTQLLKNGDGHGYFAVVPAEQTTIDYDNGNPVTDSTVVAIVPAGPAAVITASCAQNPADGRGFILMTGYKNVTDIRQLGSQVANSPAADEAPAHETP